MGQEVGVFPVYSPRDDQFSGRLLCRRLSVVCQCRLRGTGSVCFLYGVVEESAIHRSARGSIFLPRLSQRYMVQSGPERHGRSRPRKENTRIGDSGDELCDVGGRHDWAILAFNHHLKARTDGEKV